MPDLAQLIRERIEAAPDAEDGVPGMRDAIGEALRLHRHVRTGGGYWVNSIDYPHGLACVHCHRNAFGSEKDLKGLGWCSTVLVIAKGLGIEADRG